MIGGILLIILGLFFGLYVGGWVLFIGGIVQIIESIKSIPIESFGIAIGLIRILIAGFVGWFSCIICMFLGFRQIMKS